MNKVEREKQLTAADQYKEIWPEGLLNKAFGFNQWNTGRANAQPNFDL